MIFINSKDAAKLLNYSDSSLKRLRAKGRIPYYKIKGKILYRLDELEKWMEDHKRS